MLSCIISRRQLEHLLRFPVLNIDNLPDRVVFLSTRNILTLISKLDRVSSGDISQCVIIKRDTIHPKFPCSQVSLVQASEDDTNFEIKFMYATLCNEGQYNEITVYHVSDLIYYNRQPGEIYHLDEQRITKGY